MRIGQLAIINVGVLVACSLLVSSAQSCPLCGPPSLTLTEQLAQTDVCVLVQWIEGHKPGEKQAGKTVYEVKQVLRGSNDIKRNRERVVLPRYRAGQKGDLFLLFGSKGTVIEWDNVQEVTETSVNYIAQAPPPEAPTQKRLAYFMKFLEFPDQMISNDAYAEFANAPYKDITPLAQIMPREKLRKWISSGETPATRLGLYGLMMGLCGTAEDAVRMQKRIVEETEDFRLGIDGLIAGYLLLTGAQGLDVVNRTKLQNRKLPFSETYAAMQALRFMWTYGDDAIEKERLRQSMRILLDRPALADLVIADLARWKDWSVQKRLMDYYGAEEYNVPAIKRAIVRYLLVCQKDVLSSEEVEPPEHAVQAKRYLEQLRQTDPKTVKDAERFFFLR